MLAEHIVVIVVVLSRISQFPLDKLNCVLSLRFRFFSSCKMQIDDFQLKSCSRTIEKHLLRQRWRDSIAREIALFLDIYENSKKNSSSHRSSIEWIQSQRNTRILKIKTQRSAAKQKNCVILVGFTFSFLHCVVYFCHCSDVFRLTFDCLFLVCLDVAQSMSLVILSLRFCIVHTQSNLNALNLALLLLAVFVPCSAFPFCWVCVVAECNFVLLTRWCSLAHRKQFVILSHVLYTRNVREWKTIKFNSTKWHAIVSK